MSLTLFVLKLDKSKYLIEEYLENIFFVDENNFGSNNKIL